MTTSSVCGCHSSWVSFRLEDLSQIPCFISLHVWVFCVEIEAIIKHLGFFSCPAWTRFLAVSLVLYCVVHSFLWFFFSWHLCPDHTWVAELYRAICWLLHTVQICRPCVWSGCFSEKLRTYVSQLSAAECQLFHSPPYSRCTYYLTASSADDVLLNPHEYTVALSIGRGGSIAINLSPSLMGAQRVFFSFHLNFWHTRYCLSVKFCHLHASENTTFKFKIRLLS